VKDSVKDFPKEVSAPKGAPNILLILTDDVGFGASSTFGGLVPTADDGPAGQGGLRYTQFHTTALCSPLARGAALRTQSPLQRHRRHHGAALGFPGYNSLMPRSNGTFAEVLKQNGYNTAWYGKNHNVPDWHTARRAVRSLADRIGFEYFYGFIGGDTSQWAPALFENIKPIEPPHDRRTISSTRTWPTTASTASVCCTRSLPSKPWLAYYAPGTAHAPHHAPKDWIATLQGKVRQGWDKHARGNARAAEGIGRRA
jgi:arylsulfatase